MRFSAVIVAAGRGERAGGGVPKQFRPLRGRSVLLWSVDALAKAGAHEVVVAAAPEELDACRNLLKAQPAKIVAGGANRTASVRAG